jgi:DNA polymerase III subunit epsilon
MSPTAAAVEAAARLLEGEAEFVVLRRLPRVTRYAAPTDAPLKLGFFVDVETTGLEPRSDAIIQFCGVPFEFEAASGRIHALRPAITAYEDPGRPIPPFVVEKTGITDAMVAGQRLDEATILAALQEAVLVVAHNAAFDRAFLERRLPAFADRHWACSQVDVPWASYGLDSTKLEFLLYKHARTFYEAHRADEDVYAGLHLLATPFPNGELPMQRLLESARRPVFRITATGAPFEQKDALKGRGYRWDASLRAWWREVAEPAREEEELWLRSEVYAGGHGAPEVTRIDLKRRFAERG